MLYTGAMSEKKNDQGLIARLTELNQKGLSKTEMARVAGVSKQAVSGWFKNGTLSKASAIAIAEAAGVSVEWLLGVHVDKASGLKEKELKILELFRQLPDSEQDRYIETINARLEELDQFVEQYVKNRFIKK